MQLYLKHTLYKTCSLHNEAICMDRGRVLVELDNKPWHQRCSSGFFCSMLGLFNCIDKRAMHVKIESFHVI